MAPVVNAPLYTIEILRLAGSLPDPADLQRVDGTSELRSATCGSTVETQVQIDQRGLVSDISQRVSACAFGQASAALVAAHARGQTRDDVERALSDLAGWLAGTRNDPGGWGVAALAPARSRASRHGAILLPFRALLAAIEDARA